MKLKPEYERRLKDIGGQLPNGKPKLRISTPDEAVYPHGKIAGRPKYINPETERPFPWLILEMWIPPAMLPPRESWDEDILGIYPADCSQDCCNHGFWGLKTPLTISGEFLELNDSLMELIAGKQLMDLEWATLSDLEQKVKLDALKAASDKKADDDAVAESRADREHYLTHKEELDNADNRVFSWGGYTVPIIKGGKEAIGKPFAK